MTTVNKIQQDLVIFCENCFSTKKQASFFFFFFFFFFLNFGLSIFTIHSKLKKQTNKNRYKTPINRLQKKDSKKNLIWKNDDKCVICLIIVPFVVELVKGTFMKGRLLRIMSRHLVCLVQVLLSIIQWHLYKSYLSGKKCAKVTTIQTTQLLIDNEVIIY